MTKKRCKSKILQYGIKEVKYLHVYRAYTTHSLISPKPPLASQSYQNTKDRIEERTIHMNQTL